MAKAGRVDELFNMPVVTKQLETVQKGLTDVIILMEKLAVTANKNAGVLSDAKNVNQYNTAKKQQVTIQGEVNKAIQKGNDLQTKINDLQSEAVRKNIQLNQALAEKTRRTKLEQQATNQMLGAYTQLTAQLELAKIKFRDLAASGKATTAELAKVKTEVDKLDTSIKKIDSDIGEHRRNVGNYTSALGGLRNGWMKLAAVWTAAAAAGAGVIRFMQSAVKEAMAEEEQTRRIGNAMNNNAAATERMLRLRERLKKTTVFSEDEITSAITMGAELGRTEAQTRKMVETSLALSRVTGQDVNTVMMQLNGTYNGTIGRLTRLDASIGTLSETQLKNGDAVDILYTKYKKFLTDGVSSTEGQVIMLKKQWLDFTEDVGFAFLKFFNILKQGNFILTAMFGGNIKNRESGFVKRTREEIKRIQDENAAARAGGIAPAMDDGTEKIKKQTEAIKEAIPLWDAYVREMQGAVAIQKAMLSGEFTGPVRPNDVIAGMTPLESGGVKIPGAQSGLVDPGNTSGRSGIKKTKEEKQEEAAQLIQVSQDYLNQMGSLVNEYYNNEFALMDMKAEKDRADKEKELERAKGNKSQIDAINEKYDRKEKERQKEALRLKQKQARFDKAMGIMNAIINTAVAVVGMLKDPGGILGIVLSALTAAIGISQIALISSTPIPQYAKGRKGGKGEVAIVGEKGSEAVVDSTGSAYLTPDRPTLTYLPAGASVIPHDEVMDVAGRASLSGRLTPYEYAFSRTGSDNAPVVAEIAMLRREMRGKRTAHVNIDKHGIHAAVEADNYWTNYMNNNVRI